MEARGREITLTDVNPVLSGVDRECIKLSGGRRVGAWTISLGATQDALAAAGVPVVWTAGFGCDVEQRNDDARMDAVRLR